MAQSNLRFVGDRAYSYGTCLWDVLPDGRKVLNVTRYSVTSSKHRTLVVRVFGSPDMTIDNVPMGTVNLASYYLRSKGEAD